MVQGRTLVDGEIIHWSHSEYNTVEEMPPGMMDGIRMACEEHVAEKRRMVALRAQPLVYTSNLPPEDVR